MAEGSNKSYSDFLLFALTHPDGLELMNDDLSVVEGAREKVERLIRYGKDFIMDNSKEGDLIAFEMMERREFEDFEKVLGAAFQQRFGEEAEEKLREHWEQVGDLFYNQYSELADFAKKNKRGVMSLEPGQVRPGSRLVKAFAHMPWDSRLQYIKLIRRTESYISRIQRKKPQLAVMSNVHGFMVEERMKPKRAHYYPPKVWTERGYVSQDEARRRFSFIAERMIREHTEEKVRRRTRAKERMWKKKPWWKKVSIIVQKKIHRRKNK